MKPLLVGEDNPYSADPRYALYPDPDRSAGGRLCRVILKMTRLEYLRTFDRVNLCGQKWAARVAREAAERLLVERPAGAFVLCGAKVAAAFGCADHEPFSVRRLITSYALAATRTEATLYLIPHPSGRSRAWNEPWAVKRARDLLAPLLPPSESRLCGEYLGDNDATCPQLTCVRAKGHDGGCDNTCPEGTP